MDNIPILYAASMVIPFMAWYNPQKSFNKRNGKRGVF